MSREYLYFDDARLNDQLQKSAVSAYCDGGAIETSACANALAITGAILKDESPTGEFFGRLYNVTAAAVQSELNVAYAPQFQKLRKQVAALDQPMQLVLSFARSPTALIVKYALQRSSSTTPPKGMQIHHEMSDCLKFDDLADVRQWLQHKGAQRHLVKNAAPAKSGAESEGKKAPAPAAVTVDLGEGHEAASLIKSLHQTGGAPLRKATP